MLVLILRLWPHLSNYHPVVYHSFLPMRSVIWGVLIDLAVVSLLAALLFRYLKKSQTGLRTAVWAFVAAELASDLVSAVSAMHRAPIPHLSPDRGIRRTLLGALLSALASAACLPVTRCAGLECCWCSPVAAWCG
jgi:hypothetical protein